MKLLKSYWSGLKRGLCVTLVSLVVLSCGSESTVSAGISGTGIVFGTVTGFGSIFVNGVEYEIDTAEFNVDGNTSDRSDPNLGLGIGMVVRLEATDNGDGTGNASSVFYDDSIEGPITSVPTSPVGNPDVKEFTVMELNIVVNVSTTTFEDVSFNNISMDDVVEVSGYEASDGSILATRIEKKSSINPADPLFNPNSEVEIHGVVSNLNPDVSFTIGTVLIHIDQNPTLKDLDSGLSDTIEVEVEGLYQSDGSVVAQEIEGEGEGSGNSGGGSGGSSSGSISLQGLVTSFNATTGALSVNGITVDTTALSTALLALLEVGLEVEVDGELENNVLIATSLEIRAAEARFEAMVSAVDTANNSITIMYGGSIGTVTLKTDSQSQLYDDELDLPLTLSGLDTLFQAGSVEVRADARLKESEWTITSLKRRMLNDGYEIKAVVTNKTPTTSLNIAGLDFPISGSASFEINDAVSNATDFFNAITEDTTVVELEDSDKDGIMDNAEI